MIQPRYVVLGLTSLAQVAASLVQQGIGALVPFLVQTLALSHAQVGVAIAAIYAGSAVFAALSGVAVDYFGERAIILWSGCAMGAALVLGSRVENYHWLVTWLFAYGIAYGASTPAGGRAILLWFTKHRGLAMGIRQTGVPLGGVVGALLLPSIATRFGYAAALGAGGVICAVLCIAAAFWYKRPQRETSDAPRGFRSLLRGMLGIARDPRSMYVNVTCGILVSAQYIMVSFLVLTLIRQVHFSIALAAAALAVAQSAAVAARLLWGYVSDRFFNGDRMMPMALICVVSGISMEWLALISGNAGIEAFAIAVALGVSSAGWNGLFAAVQAEIGGPELAGSALGVGLTVIYGFGAVAPPVFGALADTAGFRAAWQVLGVVVLFAVIPALMARRLLAIAQDGAVGAFGSSSTETSS